MIRYRPYWGIGQFDEWGYGVKKITSNGDIYTLQDPYPNGESAYADNRKNAIERAKLLIKYLEKNPKAGSWVFSGHVSLRRKMDESQTI